MDAAEAKAKVAEIKNTGIARILVTYFQAERATILDGMVVTKDSDSLRILQGRAQQLDTLIKLFTPENK